MPRPARLAAALAAAVLALALGGAPALAHEEITPSSIQTGKPTFFTLAAANEKESPITKVQVAFPDGAAVGEATRTPAGWTASRSGQTVTWTGGKLAPGTFEQWGFEIEGADQPGTLTFTVTLTAAGEAEEVKVPVTAVAAGSAPATTVTPGAPSTTVATGSAAAGSDASDAEGRANLALGLGAAGLLLGLAALAAAVTRRRGAAPSTATPQAPQDF